MKKVLIVSLIAVSLLLLASGAMADRGDGWARWDKGCGEDCPEDVVFEFPEICCPSPCPAPAPAPCPDEDDKCSDEDDKCSDDDGCHDDYDNHHKDFRDDFRH